MKKGLAICGALLLCACARIGMEPTGDVSFVDRVTYTYTPVSLSPIALNDPHALVGFKTDRSIIKAAKSVDVFGPFLMLTTCSGNDHLHAGTILRDTTDPRPNHYVAAFHLPVRDEIIRRVGFTDDVSLLRHLSPEDICLGLYGGNMIGMTLTSSRRPFSAPDVTDDLTFSDADIDTLCPIRPEGSNYRSCAPDHGRNNG